ncbi:UMP-CMP kinase 1 isoform X1 [Schistocerca nitens]|uniref:UMP-CMP kinase 1 isoform X1 n=1 Tax=Schistocerca nitens TaxID=7011 RepID=UPI0021197201|nr:UMP-CMP kinase 1 isoform X1 [Schistocerca nitens]
MLAFTGDRLSILHDERVGDYALEANEVFLFHSCDINEETAVGRAGKFQRLAALRRASRQPARQRSAVCERFACMLVSWLNTVAKYVMSAASQKPRVIFVLGSPGSGKGTQCKNIVSEFGYIHLSAGDLLRAERTKPGSQYGELIETHIRNGTIVPVAITCKLLENAMVESSSNKFLIDGFPRNQENLDGWTANMADRVQLLGVLFLDCPQEVSTQRCLARGMGRSDDNEESLRKRFVTYMNDTLPVVKHYEQQNLVHRVDSVKPAEQVFEDVKKVILELEAKA